MQQVYTQYTPSSSCNNRNKQDVLTQQQSADASLQFTPRLTLCAIQDTNVPLLRQMMPPPFCLTPTTIGGSSHKYHFRRDKTRLLLQQKHACCDKSLVAQKYFGMTKLLS